VSVPPATPPLLALTGATGFIGQFLLQELPRRGYRLRVLLRRPTPVPLQSSSAVIGDLAFPQNMAAALAGIDVVIHTAGVSQSMSGLPEDDYRAVDTQGTIDLARAAARAGVKRFIFLSSIRAQAGAADARVLNEELEPQPADAYGRSKLAAEQGLAALDLDWAALRLTLVYGPGCRGNMAELVRLAHSRYPLPLAGLTGRRSLLSVRNLADAIDKVIAAPGPLRRPFIVADPEPLTVPQMIAALRHGLGRRPGLFPVPLSLLAAIFRLTGREEVFRRLTGSLVADASALRRLGWVPRVASAEGLADLAAQSVAPKSPI
jgi:UDP-glucose 4-epimerase